MKALIAQAHRSIYRRESIPVITDLIDNIMSIPSCLQDANSKVTLVREWIKQNPKPEKIELPEPANPDETEKLGWNDTPKDALHKKQSNKSSAESDSTNAGDKCDAGDAGIDNTEGGAGQDGEAGFTMIQPVIPKR